MQKEKFSIKKRIKSFDYAMQGLKVLFSHEHNAWIHLVAAICAIVLGFILHISAMEWIAIILVIGFVFVTEIINSAIEYLADHVSPDWHKQIKKVKDLSAAAVLVAAITALTIGLFIFIPKII